MPTQCLPAPSLRNARRLPAGRVLIRAGNPLIYRVLWPIWWAFSVVGSIFLPESREAAGGGRRSAGQALRTGYSLSECEREITVCIINSKWHSIYPTNAHERAGKAAGLPNDKVEAILSGLPTSFADKREQVVYEMATCLANSRWVAKGLYDRAVEALGHEGITDVITLMGFYTSVSMTLAFYDVPAGAEGMAR